jgi:hypothetical protein
MPPDLAAAGPGSGDGGAVVDGDVVDAASKNAAKVRPVRVRQDVYFTINSMIHSVRSSRTTSKSS